MCFRENKLGLNGLSNILFICLFYKPCVWFYSEALALIEAASFCARQQKKDKADSRKQLLKI